MAAGIWIAKTTAPGFGTHAGVSASVVAIGAFGAAVAEHLGLFGPVVRASDLAPEAENDVAEGPSAAVNVIASWRPVTDICERYDRLSRLRGQPFIPVILDGRTLTVGPILMPAGPACWRCWTRRERQHAVGPTPRRAVHDAYSQDPDLGPKGFLDAFALMAAAKTAHMIETIAEKTVVAGSLWQLDLPTRIVTTSRLIGCDGCTRCGLDRPLPTRTVEELRRSLSDLWTT
jgi:bacteriocin biosynthesis cyclodehydratase domain-containing protein